MKGLVSHSVVGGSQILPPSLCRKSCPAREAQGWLGWGVGGGEAGLSGVCGLEVLLPRLSPWSQHPRACAAHTLGPGAQGPQGTPDTKRLPQLGRKRLTLSASHAGQQAVPSTSQRKPVLGPLLSAALGGAPDQSNSYSVRNQGGLPHLRAAERQSLILKLSEGFSSLSAGNVPPLPQAFFRSHLLNRGYPDRASSAQ